MNLFLRNRHRNRPELLDTSRRQWRNLYRFTPDRLTIAAIIFILCLLASFTLLTVLVLSGSSGEFDQSILLAMRTDLGEPIGPRWAVEVGRDITALGSHAVLTLLTLTVVGYLFLHHKRGVAVVVLVATLGALGASTLLKTNIGRDRPDVISHTTHVYTASFPSGHSMLSASTYLTLGALFARVERRRRIKIFFILVATVVTLLVGASRVYLGVHWPTDVLGGWIIGAGWATACWLLARWLQQRKEIER